MLGVKLMKINKFIILASIIFILNISSINAYFWFKPTSGKPANDISNNNETKLRKAWRYTKGATCVSSSLVFGFFSLYFLNRAIDEFDDELEDLELARIRLNHVASALAVATPRTLASIIIGYTSYRLMKKGVRCFKPQISTVTQKK